METSVPIVTEVLALIREPRKCLKKGPFCDYQKSNQAFKLSVVIGHLPPQPIQLGNLFI